MAKARGFVMLSRAILDSTLWITGTNAERLVWITLLALADADSVVDESVPAIAARARVTLEECEAALATFSAPDPYSRKRHPDDDGRRIERLDSGAIVILNYPEYRDKARREQERVQNLKDVQAYRARQRAAEEQKRAEGER